MLTENWKDRFAIRCVYAWMKPRRGSKVENRCSEVVFSFEMIVKGDAWVWFDESMLISNGSRKTPLAPDLAPSENLAVICLFNKSILFLWISLPCCWSFTRNLRRRSVNIVPAKFMTNEIDTRKSGKYMLMKSDGCKKQSVN